FFVLQILLPPQSTLFPYTTLFRSDTSYYFTTRRERDTASMLPHKAIINPITSSTAKTLPSSKKNCPISRGITEIAPKYPIIEGEDRKSTRLNSSHVKISYAVFCLK